MKTFEQEIKNVDQVLVENFIKTEYSRDTMKDYLSSAAEHQRIDDAFYAEVVENFICDFSENLARKHYESNEPELSDETFLGLEEIYFKLLKSNAKTIKKFIKDNFYINREILGYDGELLEHLQDGCDPYVYLAQTNEDYGYSFIYIEVGEYKHAA